MEKTGIVEQAIESFRKNQSEGDSLHGQRRPRKLNSPVSLVQNPRLNQNAGKEDDTTMNEFDQFVLYTELKKGVEEQVNSSKANECNVTQNDNRSEENLNIMEVVPATVGDPCSEKMASEDHVESMDSIKDVEDDLNCNEHDAEKLSAEEEESNNQSDLDGEEEYVFPTPEEIKNARAPEVGMVFTSLEEAVRYVNAYGQLTGFSVIKGRNYKQTKITLQCNKCRQTKSRSKGQRVRRTSAIGRTGCQMNVIVKLVETKWQVMSCFLEHNHEMACSPSLTKFFLSHRTMSSEEKMLSKILQDIRVKPQRIMTFFRKLKGSAGNVSFGKRNLDNLKQAERKLKQNSDIKCTLKYIEKLQLRKPGFCCKMEVDGEGSVRSIFWTDARSRLDYKLFGEIICFDTTYSTNKYNMPFAPIIGINGHAKTIVFGWALLKNQKSDTFEWLFRSFVEVMEGKNPKLILTDQDAAMKKAISAVFPDAWHRFCIWHVLKCLRENMSAYMAGKEGMEDCIVGLILNSLNVAEFEAGWNEMLVTYDCAGHAHLVRMWEDRKMFVHAYFKTSFCPFTRTTGRSESFNSNFKEYVMRKDTVENFLKQYELFQENVLEVENQDRFQSSQKNPFYWCRQPIERHAASVYTRGIYLKFATELLNSTAFGVTEVIKDKVYELKKLFYYEKPEYVRDMFTVCVDRSNMTVECECGKFDKDGLLCCHILRLFTQWDVIEIPDKYIMPRWTNEFREKELMKHKQESIQVHGTEYSQNALRYALLMNSVTDVCADVSRDPEKTKEFIEEVQKLHKRLMNDGAPERQPDNNSLVLKDPPIIKKASAKKNKDAGSEVASQVAPSGRSVTVWVQEDGSISKPEEIKEKPPMSKSKNKRKQEDDEPISLGDPPVCSSKSVNKGERLKPQSEKNSKRKNPRKSKG